MPEQQTGRKVAVIGSGPAGLAAAQQLTRAGHSVTVYERDDKPGGLLRYGIPEFKMEKRLLDRRLDQMEAEGTAFVCGVSVGAESGAGRVAAAEVRAGHDAVVIAAGPPSPATCRSRAGSLAGIHQAMEFLPLANRAVDADDPVSATPISAAGKRVVIIGGGDTGADCLGTVHRQGAASVHQFEIMPRPPDERDPSTPWPTWPLMFRTSSAHEEGGERVFAVNTLEFVGDETGHVRALRACEVSMSVVDGRPRFDPVEGTEFDLPCELVLLALGFSGPEPALAEAFGVSLTPRGTIARSGEYETDVPGVFVCWRRRAGPEPDRVGDRRGPFSRCGDRPVAGRADAPARAVAVGDLSRFGRRSWHGLARPEPPASGLWRAVRAIARLTRHNRGGGSGTPGPRRAAVPWSDAHGLRRRPDAGHPRQPGRHRHARYVG